MGEMTKAKNYPVTPQVNLPQPHVNFPDRKPESCRYSGWLPFVFVGICATLFLVIILEFGGAKIFPVSINIYAGLVPIDKKGYLQVLPFDQETNHSIHDTIYVKLPLSKAEVTEHVRVFEELLKGYPEKREEPYRNCWLQNPSIDHPCFYDRSWITELCSRNNSYGYDLDKGEYNPCFILRLADTEDWIPIPPFYHSNMNPSLGYESEEFDHGFIPVVCIAQDETSKNIGVDIYPPKGFSLLYFPQSNFKNSYLSPLVAVKVNSIHRNKNITIDCSVVTPNAFVLGNNGRISVTFSS